MTITYRDAISLDLPVLVSMERLLFADSPWSMGQFKEEFSGVPKTRKFLVAQNSAHQIIGYAAALVVSAGVESDVLTVAVDPAYRSAGVGSTFMQLLEQWARDKQASAMMLEVGVENVPAITLYEKLGYLHISRRANYYGPGLDALVMRKEL